MQGYFALGTQMHCLEYPGSSSPPKAATVHFTLESTSFRLYNISACRMWPSVAIIPEPLVNRTRDPAIVGRGDAVVVLLVHWAVELLLTGRRTHELVYMHVNTSLTKMKCSHYSCPLLS